MTTVFPAAVQTAMQHADFVSCESVATPVPMADFLAGFFQFSPAWLRGLYGVRLGFVRLLGVQSGMPTFSSARRAVPMEVGARMAFFTVEHVTPGLWMAVASERHLQARIAVWRDGALLRVATVVHHRHWTGPVYFAFVRPFHHLVVRGMVQAGARPVSGPD